MEITESKGGDKMEYVLPDSQGQSNFLSCARQEMYNALSLFHNHVKYTVSLMFALLTSVFAILGYVLSGKISDPTLLYQFKVIGALILSLMFPLGAISIIIIGRYYKLYVAALFFAAEIHKSAGLHAHLWLEQVISEMESLSDGAKKISLINKRTFSWPHSWILYSILISLISIAGLISGIIILLGASSCPPIEQPAKQIGSTIFFLMTS